jgi:hypothetical protein
LINLGNYLIVITGRQWIGSLDGHDVYTMTNTELFRFARSDAHLTPQQVMTSFITSL